MQTYLRVERCVQWLCRQPIQVPLPPQPLKCMCSQKVDIAAYVSKREGEKTPHFLGNVMWEQAWRKRVPFWLTYGPNNQQRNCFWTQIPQLPKNLLMTQVQTVCSVALPVSDTLLLFKILPWERNVGDHPLSWMDTHWGWAKHYFKSSSEANFVVLHFQ